MQDPDAAAAAASKNAANAAKAESEETAATAEESAAHSKAGELGKVDKANTDAAAEENMKQAFMRGERVRRGDAEVMWLQPSHMSSNSSPRTP